jgi:hypothetical protein
MGTRADFYVGRGPNAEWLGSIAWDGYPQRWLKRGMRNDAGVPLAISNAKTEVEYREAVKHFLARRDDKTLPAQGWPWPWETSSTTDYAYAFIQGRKGNPKGTVYTSCFGSAWYNAQRRNAPDKRHHPATFPDMSKAPQREKFGAHSGVMVISTPS